MAPVWYHSTSWTRCCRLIEYICLALDQPLIEARPYLEKGIKNRGQVVGILIAHRISWLLGPLSCPRKKGTCCWNLNTILSTSFCVSLKMSVSD